MRAAEWADRLLVLVTVVVLVGIGVVSLRELIRLRLWDAASLAAATVTAAVVFVVILASGR